MARALLRAKPDRRQVSGTSSGPELLSIEAALARLSSFDSILDARTPAEHQEDHIPGACCTPVLSNEERVLIGTQYKSDSFEAKRLGAAKIARNVATLLETELADKPRRWSALVYCWRGGNRSGALATILSKVGWRISLIEGGYKAFRQHVLASMPGLVEARTFRVVCGVTGSGKTRFLDALARQGAAVLDLEKLAQHRGSLLGAMPESPQPSQKAFESRVWAALRSLPMDQPIYVESESKKIGNVQVPEALMTKMRASACVDVCLEMDPRVSLLCEEYQHFFSQPTRLLEQIEKLRPLVGDDMAEQWRGQVEAGDWRSLVRGLLEHHYDPSYRRSISRNFPGHAQAVAVRPSGITPADYDAAASILLGKRSTS